MKFCFGFLCCYTYSFSKKEVLLLQRGSSPCFFRLMFLILIPGKERQTLPCPIAELSTNVVLFILHWPESAMPVSIEGSNCKPEENLLLKTSLAHHFGVTSLEHLIDSIGASISGLVSHCTLPEHIYY